MKLSGLPIPLIAKTIQNGYFTYNTAVETPVSSETSHFSTPPLRNENCQKQQLKFLLCSL